MSDEASTFGVPVGAGGTGAPVVPSQPPTISTRPSGRTVAACDSRAAERVDAASVKLLDVGSKSSRLASPPADGFAEPPARSTLPLARSVAVWPDLATISGPAAVQVLAEGSKISAVSVALPVAPVPPATSTRPS